MNAFQRFEFSNAEDEEIIRRIAAIRDLNFRLLFVCFTSNEIIGAFSNFKLSKDRKYIADPQSFIFKIDSQIKVYEIKPNMAKYSLLFDHGRGFVFSFGELVVSFSESRVYVSTGEGHRAYSLAFAESVAERFAEWPMNVDETGKAREVERYWYLFMYTYLFL